MKSSTSARIIKFSDGSLSIYPPGAAQARAKFNFKNYKVGVKRFYAALSSGFNITKCVRIPQSSIELNGTEAVEILGKKYEIKQIQYDDKTSPKTLILALADAT